MPAALRTPYNAYDHRLKALVAHFGCDRLADDLDIPRTTVASWRRQHFASTVSHEILDVDTLSLQARLVAAERERDEARAVVVLLTSLMQLMGWSLQRRRLDTTTKQAILGLVDIAKGVLPLAAVLDAIGLARQRHQVWVKRAAACRLEDHSSCPRLSPAKLLTQELRKIKEIFLDPALAHMPLFALAHHAMRRGLVAASPSTWRKTVTRLGLRRPRHRVHPGRPRVGIRATRPNEIWHVDSTVLWLGNGTRACIQAVIDNFSRRILAWSVSSSPTAIGCRNLLLAALHEAARLRVNGLPRLICDAGAENVNALIDKLVAEGRLIREIAQIDIAFSNSLIEAFWRSLKNNHLFQHSLSSIDVLQRLVAFYVEQHNAAMPHSALGGATPDEVYVGQWAGIVRTAVKHEYAAARQRRIDYHRSLPRCDVCRDP